MPMFAAVNRDCNELYFEFVSGLATAVKDH